MDDTAHRTTPAPVGDALQEPAVVRAELDRILSSSTFQHAKHAQRFLRHIVEAALAGRGNDLKEYTVGVEVFGKDASFDPRIDSIVRTEARRLRARLQDFYDAEGDQGNCRIVLRKGSYVPSFEAAVARAAADQPPPAPPATVSPERRAALGPRLGLIAAGVLAAVVVALVFGRFLSDRTVATAPTSIVVLPFVNLSGADREFLSDGITEEVINSLGRIPDLRVIGRASAFQFKGEKIDLREIGRRLGVRYVLEGSVKESAGRLRISVWLEDTATGFRDWSQTFERDLQDTWIVEREIAAAIANALGNTVADKRGIDARLAGGSPVVNSEAYQLYLKGRYFWNKSTAADIETGINCSRRPSQRTPAMLLRIPALRPLTTPCSHSAPIPSASPRRRSAPPRHGRWPSMTLSGKRMALWRSRSHERVHWPRRSGSYSASGRAESRQRPVLPGVCPPSPASGSSGRRPRGPAPSGRTRSGDRVPDAASGRDSLLDAQVR